MSSPVPRHLRTENEILSIPARLRDHRDDLRVEGVAVLRPAKHPAKYAPGLPTALLRLAGVSDVGDPMAGTGRLAEETGLPIKLNDLDPKYRPNLERCAVEYGCDVSFLDARCLEWSCDTMIFSPPYYPRTDRRRPAAHNDIKRGGVVGFRTSYNPDDSIVNQFIGEPAGVNGILTYRNQMRSVYAHLITKAKRMIVVVKNWTRLGVELRLDADTILTAGEAGWVVVGRTGFRPQPSLWSRFNASRGGGVQIEDVLIFERRERRHRPRRPAHLKP